jgi:hypothetical protein
MEASTSFLWTFRFVTAPRAGNSHAYRELEMRRRATTKRISLIVTYDTDIETATVDHPIAFQSAPAATISIFDDRKAMSVGRSRGAYGFFEQDRIQSVDRLECVTSELAVGVSL